MHQKLPKEIDPLRLAQNGLVLEGRLPLSEMKRLTEALHGNEGMVDVKMSFALDEVGAPFMRGEFNVTISLMCERCFEPMSVDLVVSSLLAIVRNEKQIEGLAEQYEPWLLDSDNPVWLAKVIEDELILALPIIPRHDSDCLPEDAWSVGDEGQDDSETEKQASPFAVLSTLRSKP